MKIKTLVALALIGFATTSFACPDHPIGKKVDSMSAGSASTFSGTSNLDSNNPSSVSANDVGSADTTTGDDDY